MGRKQLYKEPDTLTTIVERPIAQKLRAEAHAHGVSLSAVIGHILTSYATRPVPPDDDEFGPQPSD